LPILDQTDQPAGVLAVVIETTQRVLADRRLANEHHRLQMFVQSPTFMAMLAGPDHTFEMFNPECSRLIGRRDVIGQPFASALPEIVEQGFLPAIDNVFETGKPATRRSAKVDFHSVDRDPDERSSTSSSSQSETTAAISRTSSSKAQMSQRGCAVSGASDCRTQPSGQEQPGVCPVHRCPDNACHAVDRLCEIRNHVPHRGDAFACACPPIRELALS